MTDESKIEKLVVLILVILVVALSVVFLVPLLTVLNGASGWWLLTYCFLWPLIFVIQGVLEVDVDAAVRKIKRK